MKDSSNINRSLRFSTINNRDKSNKGTSNRDNPRFKNLKANNKKDPRLNNHNSNNVNRRFSNPRDSRTPNNSSLNLRASNTREDHNPHTLKESLKEEMQNIESRGLMSHLAAK